MNKNLRLPYLVIYALVLLIAFFTPMHSDDFHFYWLGLSITKHLDQYMLFCGRFFIDYFSSLVLLINNHLVIAIINSLALPLLLYNIATIPYYNDDKQNYKKNWLIAIFLFVTYWLGNPALGETTFWLVGAANYLWPLVIFSFFVKFLFRTFYQNTMSKKDYWLLIPLAFFSAINEINGLLVLFILAVLITLAYYKKLSNKVLLISCLIAALISYIVLIAAPGNYVRAASEEFVWWYQMSSAERVTFYLEKVLPKVFKGFLVVFVVIAWGLWQAKGHITKLNRYFIGLFTGCFLLFCLALFVSPGSLTTRSYLTGLFCLLIILSFLLITIFREDNKLSLVNKILMMSFIGWFVISYLFVVKAYYILYRQDLYRIQLITAQKQRGEKILTIPRYHYPFVLQEGDLPSGFHNPIKMAEYYGVKEINQYFADTGFDYGQLASLPCHKVPNNPYLKCIYVEKLLFENTTKFIFEFNTQVTTINNYKRAFSMKLSAFDNKGAESYFITMPLDIRPLGNRLFAVANTVTNLLTTDNKQVNIAIFSSMVNKEDSKLLDAKLSL